MHSLYTRLNSVLTWASTVLSAILVATALTDVFNPCNPDISLAVNDVLALAPSKLHWTAGDDMVDLEMNLEADFSTCMWWNTKEIYLSISAEYVTPKHWLNQVTIYDKILTRDGILKGKINATLSRPKLRQKYPFIDDGNNMKGRQVDLVVDYNLIPNTGYIRTYQKRFNKAVQIPQEYFIKQDVSPKATSGYYKIDKKP